MDVVLEIDVPGADIIERMGGRIKILTEKNTEKNAGTSIEVQLPQWAKA